MAKEEKVFEIVKEVAEAAKEKAAEAVAGAAEKAKTELPKVAEETAKKGVKKGASFLEQRRKEADPRQVVKNVYYNLAWDLHYWDRITKATIWFLAAAVVWSLYYLYIRAVAGYAWTFKVFNFTVTFEVGRFLATVDYLYTPAHLAMILAVYSFVAFMASYLVGVLKPYIPKQPSISLTYLTRATLYFVMGYMMAPLVLAPLVAYVVSYLFMHPIGYIVGFLATIVQTLLGALAGLSLSSLAVIPVIVVLLVFAVLAAVAIFAAMFTCTFLASSTAKMLEAMELQALIVGLLLRLVFRPPLAWLGVVGAGLQYATAFVLALYAVYAGIVAALKNDWRGVMNLPGLALVWYMARTGAAGFAVLGLADAIAVAYGQLFNTPGAQLAVTAARFLFAWFF